MRYFRASLVVAVALGSGGFAGCRGEDGAAGRPGSNGDAGPQGPEGGAGPAGDAGPAGEAGKPGKNGLGVEIESFHGAKALADELLANDGKYKVKATITAAAIDAAGKGTLDFKIETITPDGKPGAPVVGVKPSGFSVAKLRPKAPGESFNQWVPYIYRSEVVSGSDKGDWPRPDGTAADQGYRENDGILTDKGDGSYSYAFKTSFAAVKTPVGGKDVALERNRTHRAAVTMGGHSGPTADATFDFVPDGSAIMETRNIVQTSTCEACHGDDFHGHGGDRLSVETCVTCHNPSTTDAQSGNTVDMKVMIHKIHAGAEMASTPGPDGLVWDDPATPANEAADNGTYAIWGNGNNKHEWWDVGFPAVIENCTKCHQGSGENVDNWKRVPSRAACGSCHDDIDWTRDADHEGGVQLNDNDCVTCHKDSGGGLGKSVAEAHDWAQHDERNIPEFTVDLTVSTPANGTHFVKGEAPVVTVVLKEAGVPIDHTTVVQDTCTGMGCVTAEGCAAGAPCPPRDGKFMVAGLFVHGPRARRNPVLTTAARAEILSATTGPFDISAMGATLIVRLDGGKDLYLPTAVKPLAGTVAVAVPAMGAFASSAAATVGELVAWLNKDSAFKARAIAYVEKGKAAIRSRNLGNFYSVQLPTSLVGTAVFGADTSVKSVGGGPVSPTGSFPVNQIFKYEDPTKNDPKVSWYTDRITYQLDPVDDLRPGTYIATVEIADRGRKSETDYKTPSVAKTPFQVGTKDPEKPPANNCDTCHRGPEGTGFVLDFSRHNKIFDHTAVDQCGACHDYQSRDPGGAWTGGMAIARRVHAVHFGANLNYPLATVGYANGDPVKGRNWDLAMPLDLRNCDTTCHGPETSGTWATKPSRMPCWGCHDSDAAQAHFKIMTYDPTPLDPWSGDEEESCATCH